MKTQTLSEVDFLRNPEEYNGISLDLVSHDLLYQQLQESGAPIILINDYVAELGEGQVSKELNSLIRTHYGTDELDTIPRCDCGDTYGGYNEGVICPNCKSKVMRVVDKPLISNIWIKPPSPMTAFINPHFWNLFETVFKTAKFSLIEYLTCRSYIPGGGVGKDKSKDTERVINALNQAGIKRGMDYFYDNFDYIMEEVLRSTLYVLKPGKIDKECPERTLTKEQLCSKMRLIVQHYRKCIFSHYLPFPSKLIMVSEEGSGVGYIDKNLPLAMDALKTIIQLERPKVPMSPRTIETKTMRVNKEFAEFYSNFRNTSYGKKPGMARKQQGSTRSPMSGRAVIAPIAHAHKYDELITPWSWTISMCRVQIANKLLRMFYTPQELFLFVDKCIVNSDGPDGDIMEGIFHTLMDESPSKGLDVSMLRNPTLVRLSNQYFTIVKVLRNKNMNAIMMSVLTIKGPNADYDGDQLQVKLLVDAKEKEQFSRLSSHLGLMDAANPLEVNKAISLHPECISMVNTFLDYHRVDADTRNDDEMFELTTL